MSARADFTGTYTGPDFPTWIVIRKAPAQKRIPMWTVGHIAVRDGGMCPQIDVPHTLVKAAIDGKGSLPPCMTCHPVSEENGISHGMVLHRECGKPHLVGAGCATGDLGRHLACGGEHELGAPCADGVHREPGPHLAPGVRMPATTQDYPPYDFSQHLAKPLVWSLGEDEPEPCDIATCKRNPDGELENVCSEICDELVESLVPPMANYPATALPAGEFEYKPESIEPEGHLVDASTGEVEVWGRVDRLERPQAILDVIRAAMAAQQRNHQSEPGPSQLGGCERRLGYHLATGIGNGRSDDSAWRPQVGTAVHAWLDEVFKAAGPRWLSGYRVTNPVAGTIDIGDLFDRLAVDFKVSGANTLKKAARKQIAEKYQVQLDVYAAGLIADGAVIERVALLFLPAAGSLSESVWYERDYDPQRAADAIDRRDRVRERMADGDLTKLAELDIEDDWCSGCPVFATPYCDGAAISAPAALGMVGAP